MRKVKLQDTGELSTDVSAYKAPNNKYYSSEEAYKKITTNAEYRMKCIDAIYEALEYQTYMKLPTYFYKRLKECEGYGYDVVYRCIKNETESIRWAIRNKDFRSEVGKMMYIWAILNNHMNDALKQVVAERRMNEKKDTVEQSVNVDIDIKNKEQHVVDISRFLED